MSNEDYLAHYGVRGMKWGVWNAETAARYAGRHTKSARGKMKALVKQKKEEHESRVASRRKKRQFDRMTRKTYKLSAKKYNQLRNTTLKSNDPEVVKRGMHLLTDEELNKKIDRLERENKITKLSTEQATRKAAAKKARGEARANTLPYKLTKYAVEKTVDNVNTNLVKPILGDLSPSISSKLKGALNDATQNGGQKQSKKSNKSGQSSQKVEEKEDKKVLPSYEKPMEAYRDADRYKELIRKRRKVFRNMTFADTAPKRAD